jgi:hypothetical protein
VGQKRGEERSAEVGMAIKRKMPLKRTKALIEQQWPEPPILRKIGSQSESNGTSTFTSSEIQQIIKSVRTGRKRREQIREASNSNKTN